MLHDGDARLHGIVLSWLITFDHHIAIQPETLCSGRVLTALREEKGLNAKEEEKEGDGEGTSASLDS